MILNSIATLAQFAKFQGRASFVLSHQTSYLSSIIKYDSFINQLAILYD